MPSVFTQRPRSEWIAHNELAFAIRDGFPVSPGHSLVVPFREVATWFEVSAEERAARPLATGGKADPFLSHPTSLPERRKGPMSCSGFATRSSSRPLSTGSR